MSDSGKSSGNTGNTPALNADQRNQITAQNNMFTSTIAPTDSNQYSMSSTPTPQDYYNQYAGTMFGNQPPQTSVGQPSNLLPMEAGVDFIAGPPPGSSNVQWRSDGKGGWESYNPQAATRFGPPAQQNPFAQYGQYADRLSQEFNNWKSNDPNDQYFSSLEGFMKHEADRLLNQYKINDYYANNNPDQNPLTGGGDYWYRGMDWNGGQDTGKGGEIMLGGQLYIPQGDGTFLNVNSGKIMTQEMPQMPQQDPFFGPGVVIGGSPKPIFKEYTGPAPVQQPPANLASPGMIQPIPGRFTGGPPVTPPAESAPPNPYSLGQPPTQEQINQYAGEYYKSRGVTIPEMSNQDLLAVPHTTQSPPTAVAQPVVQPPAPVTQPVPQPTQSPPTAVAQPVVQPPAPAIQPRPKATQSPPVTRPPTTSATQKLIQSIKPPTTPVSRPAPRPAPRPAAQPAARPAMMPAPRPAPRPAMMPAPRLAPQPVMMPAPRPATKTMKRIDPPLRSAPPMRLR